MIGLYVHIPFCVKKCKYCDFISFDNCQNQQENYINNLMIEMREYRRKEIDTVFIGGGTPTCLSEELLEKLLRAINENFNIREVVEFTVEANPKTLSGEKLEIMKKYGVNRLSVGVQSFCDKELKKIGRVHDAKTAIETIKMVKDYGFANFSIDLMSALPGQTMNSFAETLRKAVEQEPTHISCYSLILEENTPLRTEYENGNISLPNEETEREMYDFACEFLNKHGYRRYEISNFAKIGKQSIHNMKYWSCLEYIGIGIAAHSYLDGVRFSNVTNLAAYLGGKYHSEEKNILTLAEKIEDFVIMGLRMSVGISREEFQKRFHMRIEDVYEKEISKFLKSGFLKNVDKNICLSDKGVSVSNSIMCEFVSCNLKISD